MEEIFGFLHNVGISDIFEIIQFFQVGFLVNRMNSLCCTTMYDKNRMHSSFHSWMFLFFFFVTGTDLTYFRCYQKKTESRRTTWEVLHIIFYYYLICGNNAIYYISHESKFVKFSVIMYRYIRIFILCVYDLISVQLI